MYSLWHACRIMRKIGTEFGHKYQNSKATIKRIEGFHITRHAVVSRLFANLLVNCFLLLMHVMLNDPQREIQMCSMNDIRCIELLLAWGTSCQIVQLNISLGREHKSINLILRSS